MFTTERGLRWPGCCFSAGRNVLRLLTAVSLFCCTIPAFAVNTLTLLALFEDKALFHIDGERRLMQAGERSPEGLLLIKADSNEAVVEVNGRQEVLHLGLVTTFPGSDAPPEPTWTGPETVSLWADPNGFFYTAGLINGFPVRFLVDTGATTIALSSELAKRIGIDIAKGQRGVANTAAGLTQMYGLNLKSVTVGGITLKDISAGVIVGNYPTTPLLGMSFLGQLDMVREGNRMELKTRH
ncbi:MAG: TIGR02281 family clan AA aspartic protease [Arenicellales bacterium]|nr:TIGR02281 family clan AA aspartic protease [Arenicellales bacterium]